MPWVLAAVAVFVLSFELGSRELSSPDETRYAAISRSMLDTGDWLTPVHNFKFRHWHKPPLTYWLMASSFHVLGYNDWAARVPSALAALAAVMGVYVIGRTLHSPRAGFLAGVVLLASPLFFILARLANADMLLCAFITWSWVGFVQFPLGERRRTLWFMVGAAFAGLGFMTKGPVVLMSTFVPMLLYTLLTNQWKRIGWWRPLAALGVFLVVALPWYVIVSIKNPGLFRYFVEYQTFQRITTTIHERTQPFHFFFGVVFLGFLPWLVLMLAAVWDLFVRDDSEPAADPSKRLAPLIWFAVVFIFITLSTSKLVTYCLPLFPAMALLVGPFVARVLERRVLRGVMAWDFMLASGCLLVLAVLLICGFRAGHSPSPEMDWLKTRGAAVGAVAAAFAAASLVALTLRRIALCTASLVAAVLFPLLFGSLAVVGHEDELGVGNSGNELAQLIRPREATDKYREVAVVMYRRYLMELPYYLGHPAMCLDCHIERSYVRPDGTKVWFYTEDERDALYDGYYRENGRNQLRAMVRLKSRRLLIVTDKESYDDISTAFVEDDTPLVYFIAEVGEFVLCSNHPDEPPGEAPPANGAPSGEE